MKSLLLMTSLLLSLSSFAQTDVIITPDIPTSCQGTDNRPMVNWISGITNLQEDQSKVTFAFKVMVGACISGKPSYHDINEAKATVSLWKSGLSMPFSKSPFKISKSVTTPGVLDVEITFDKAKIFKNGQLTRDFSLQYFPFGLPQRYFYANGAWSDSRVPYCPWSLKLIKHDDFNTDFKLN